MPSTEVLVTSTSTSVEAPQSPAPVVSVSLADGSQGVEIVEVQQHVVCAPLQTPVALVEAPAAQGPPGPPGPTGPAGGSSITVVAGETLSGHRGVRFDATGQAFYAHPDDGTCAGVTLSAALVGNTVQVQLGGQIIEPSWAWDPDEPIYLAASGILTQDPVDADSLVEMGVALSATSMMLRIQQTIYED